MFFVVGFSLFIIKFKGMLKREEIEFKERN